LACFWIASGLCLVLFFIIKKQFPYNKPVFNGSYKQLLVRFHLNQGATFMREATLINVFSFAQFGAWTTMVLLLSEEPFNFTSTTIGLFGIIGASGWQLL
jgi:hypothetical protein